MIMKLKYQKPLAVLKQDRASIYDLNYNALPPALEAEWYDAHKEHKPALSAKKGTRQTTTQPALANRNKDGLRWFKLQYADGLETYIRAANRDELINELKQMNRQYGERLPVQVKIV